MVDEDRISNLSSDLLISIISRLTLKEATSTCILSTRWRYLHTYVTSLIFQRYRYGVGTDSIYSKMVDHVLNSHRGTKIKEFSLLMSKGRNFERWFEFALSKKAESIHLRGYHRIDYKALFLRLPNTNNGFECLKDLYLYHSRMTEQDFELLLSNCIALESLKFEFPIDMKNVSIVGHNKLKHLDLSYSRVDSIVIRDAISLVSLTMYGLHSECSVQINNTPNLTGLYVGDDIFLKLLYKLLTGMPSCVRDQLQIMHLSIEISNMSQVIIYLSIYYIYLGVCIYIYINVCDFNLQRFENFSWVGLVNVKYLRLSIYEIFDCPWLNLSPNLVRSVEACSCLDKLVIQVRINLGI